MGNDIVRKPADPGAKVDATATAAVADRRGFLKLAGAGVVSSGAALAGSIDASAEPAHQAKPDGAYHVTEHIRHYYDSAR